MRQRSLLDDLGEEVTGIVAPVSLCMAITVLLVRLLNPEGKSSSNTVLIASIAYQENSADSAGKKFGGAILNAIIFVAVVGGMTVVLFILFKYGCYKVIWGYMGFAVFNIFFAITGSVFIQVLQVMDLHIDAFSLAYGLFNFSVVGTLGILFMPIPLLAKQLYLIWVGIIVAYIFTFIPEWTAWVLLVLMALYDIAAVLIPGGPLKALVEMAVERRQELPALIYEARPARGPYVRGWGNRGGNQGSEDPNSPAGPPPPQQQQAPPPDQQARYQPPQQQLPPGHVGPQAVAEGGTTPGRHVLGQAFQVSQQPPARFGAAPLASETSTPVEAMRAGSDSGDSDAGGGAARRGRPRPLGEGREDNEWEMLPPAPNAVNEGAARSLRPGTGSHAPGAPGDSSPPTPPSRYDSSKPLIPQPDAANDYGVLASPTREAQSHVTRGNSRLRPTSGHSGSGDCGAGGARMSHMGGPGYDPTMGVRAPPPAIDPEALVAASHSRAVSNPSSGRHNSNGQPVGADDPQIELPDGIKLGLGDFIFYSMLVGRAAMYDMMTVFASYLAIIAGLGLTLLCLAIFQKALPALPFSIALGVAFYFLTRLTLEPFLVPLATHYVFY